MKDNVESQLAEKTNKTSLCAELENIKEKIVEELKKGKEVNLKNTPKGLKVQVIKANTLR